MSFPEPSDKQREETRRLRAEIDAKIEELRRKIRRLEEESAATTTTTVRSLLPRRVRAWLQRRRGTTTTITIAPDVAESIRGARVEI